MIFLRIRRGKCLTLGSHWGKTKCQLMNPFSCHPPFVLLTFPYLTQSTTTLNTPNFSWAVIAGQWCVVGLSLLSHTHTPPADSFTLMWAFFHSGPSSSRDSRSSLHAQAWHFYSRGDSRSSPHAQAWHFYSCREL